MACGVPSGSVELYVQRGSAVNAYAVGGRSVAVTSGIVSRCAAGMLDARAIEAVLAHELGHSRSRGSGLLPITVWLALPWRVFYRAVLRAGLRLVGRQPRCLLAVVAIAGFTIALVQAAREARGGGFAVLGSLVVYGLGAPVADQALSRPGERAADDFAAAAGYGPDLARALQILDARSIRRRRLSDRVLDTHPDVARRIEQLSQHRGDDRPHPGHALMAA